MVHPVYPVRLISGCLLALFSLTLCVAHGATLYVSKDGDDGNPGTRSKPFLNIQAAIDASKRNGRIIVGPGKYVENLVISENALDESLDGLKLESSAGRWATVIDGDDSVDGDGDGIPVIEVRAFKVQIGRKGKGFTVQNAGDPVAGIPAAGLDYVGAQGKIEGNWFVENPIGAFVAGYLGETRKLQIRGNIFSDNADRGLYCLNCNGAIIRENRASGNTVGIDLASTGSATVQKNVLMGNAIIGLWNQNSNGGNRIQDNVLVRSSNNGYIQTGIGGDLVQGNITAKTGTGINISQLPGSSGQVTKKNLSVANTGDGFYIGTGASHKFEQNSAFSNVDDGMQVSSTASFTSFSRNNAVESNCGIEIETGLELQYLKQYFHQGLMPDTCGGGTVHMDATTVDKANPIMVNTARKL